MQNQGHLLMFDANFILFMLTGVKNETETTFDLQFDIVMVQNSFYPIKLTSV